MAENLPPDLVRRGWDSEVAEHRKNLRHALSAVSRSLATLQTDLDGDGGVNTHAARQMVIDASEAAQLVYALSALNRVRFVLPDPPA